MIQLTVLVKRNPALSVDEFHRRWREHGRMIADEPAFRRHIRRYEQHHRSRDDYGATGDTYDGLALQWYDSFDDFLAILGDAAYTEKLQPDEAVLLDMDKLVVLFTELPEVFIE
ncbi:MAG: EthD domain-containing protein [Acidimicrobiales bacterium]